MKTCIILSDCYTNDLIGFAIMSDQFNSDLDLQKNAKKRDKHKLRKKAKAPDVEKRE